MDFIRDWINDMKEPTEISFFELVGIIIFIVMLGVTNNFNLAVMSMIICLGLFTWIGYAFDMKEKIQKKFKFI